MWLPKPRTTYLLLFICIVGLMSYGLYSQYVNGLEPCPLCMTQRFFYCLMGVLALLAWLQHPKVWGNRVYAGLISLSGVGGIASAGRQVWLQHLPAEQVPACGPSLSYMFDVLPWQQTLQALLTGDGNCAEVVWQWWGLSMGEWSLLWFIALTGVAVWQGWRKVF